MDLNHLLYHHQLSVLQAQTCEGVAGTRAAHLAEHYRKRIERLRRQMGVAVYPSWCGPAAGAVA